MQGECKVVHLVQTLMMCWVCLRRQVDGIGRAQVSTTLYGFTDMQDLRLVPGLQGAHRPDRALSPRWGPALLTCRGKAPNGIFGNLASLQQEHFGGAACQTGLCSQSLALVKEAGNADCWVRVQSPYGRLQENNWSLFFDFKGYWGVRYDL